MYEYLKCAAAEKAMVWGERAVPALGAHTRHSSWEQVNQGDQTLIKP